MMQDDFDIFDKLRPDRTIAEPVYQQLMRRIIGLIETGEIASNGSLPSERLLAEKLLLSRTTVRRCYAELHAKNLLTSKGRSGFAVNDIPNLQPQMGRLKGFTEEMKELGLTPSTHVLEKAIVTDRTIASIVGRPSHAEFLRLVRVRLGDDVPLSREVAWYDLTVAPMMAEWDATGSIYDTLKTVCNIRLGKAEQTIEAVMSSAEESLVFGFDQSSPCLLFKRKTYTLSGQIVEYVEGTFRGDAYTYHIDLNAN